MRNRFSFVQQVNRQQSSQTDPVPSAREDQLSWTRTKRRVVYPSKASEEVKQVTDIVIKSPCYDIVIKWFGISSSQRISRIMFEVISPVVNRKMCLRSTCNKQKDVPKKHLKEIKAKKLITIIMPKRHQKCQPINQRISQQYPVAVIVKGIMSKLKLKVGSERKQQFSQRSN
ncbi:unnamed protein product [Caenorhabditis brenneri]